MEKTPAKRPIFCHGETFEHEASSNGAGDFSVGEGDLGEILGPVVVDHEVDRLAVDSEAGIGRGAVQGARQDFGVSASSRADGNVLGGVFEEFGIELSRIDDPLAIRRPSRGAIATRIGGDLGKMRAFVGVVGRDDPNIPIVGGVGIGLGAIAGKRKGLAVGRPCGLGVVIVAGSHLGE